MLKIIITGDRGDGKTVLLTAIERYLEELGYDVRSVDEGIARHLQAEHRSRLDLGAAIYENRPVDVVVTPSVERDHSVTGPPTIYS